MGVRSAAAGSTARDQVPNPLGGLKASLACCTCLVHAQLSQDVVDAPSSNDWLCFVSSARCALAPASSLISFQNVYVSKLSSHSNLARGTRSRSVPRQAYPPLTLPSRVGVMVGRMRPRRFTDLTNTPSDSGIEKLRRTAEMQRSCR